MTTATRSDLDELKRLLPVDEYFRRQGSTQDARGRWRCLCAASHTNGDAHHSVTIDEGYARCWSQGCFGDKGADIFAVVGVVEHLSDFKSQKRRVQELAGVHVDSPHAARQILRRFRYRDGNGREAWKLRWNTDEPGKKCTWARDPDGLVSGKGDCTPTLYELEHVMAALYVLLCEGERDADTLNAWLTELGLAEYMATTTPNGASDVKEQYLQPLHGKAHVYLSGDNDDPGRGYVQKCGALLRGRVPELRHLIVPDGLKDWTEWRDRGATAQDFQRLLDAALHWTRDEDPRVEVVPTVDAWPVLNEAAYHGLAGEVVRLFDPDTEADPVAVLVSFLSEVGTMLGRAPHLILDGSYHPLLFWPITIGTSSKSRKGTATKKSDTICQVIDPDWTRGLYKGTPSTGEGLAFAVRDAEYRDEPVKTKGQVTGETVRLCVDPGVTDKRLHLVVTEFGAMLRTMRRDGNSLSGTLRDAWDGLNLCPMTKGSRVRATAPHISLVGHVTTDELLRNLDDTEASNGFGNRFVWFLVRRSKELPFPSAPDAHDLDTLAGRLGARLRAGRMMGRLELDPSAREAWQANYHDLSRDRPGLAGTLLGRAEAQVMRLSALYAVLDGTAQISVVHMRAALAMWMYAEQSVEHLFGDRTGDPDADTILAALRQKGALNNTEISSLFSFNRPKEKIDRAKARLQTAGLAVSAMSETGGRPVEVWRATVLNKVGEPTKKAQ